MKLSPSRAHIYIQYPGQSNVILPQEDVLGLFFHSHVGDFHATIVSISSRYPLDIDQPTRLSSRSRSGNTWSRWIDWQRFNRVVNKTYVPPSRYLDVSINSDLLLSFPDVSRAISFFPSLFSFSLFSSSRSRREEGRSKFRRFLNFVTGRMIGGMLVLWCGISGGYLGKVIVEEDIFKMYFSKGEQVSLFYYFFGIHRNVKKEIYKMNV